MRIAATPCESARLFELADRLATIAEKAAKDLIGPVGENEPGQEILTALDLASDEYQAARASENTRNTDLENAGRVSTAWKYVILPLACRRAEQCSQWIACEEKYSVPSRASRSAPPGER